MKSLLLSAAALVVVVAAGVHGIATHVPASPFDGNSALAAAPTTPAEGEYAVRLSDCVACHSVEGGQPFAGGLEMGTPIGSVFSTNITPDRETGIGGWTLAQFDRAVRHGVRPDGARLYPAMPYPSYAKLTDEDVKRLYDYFLNEVKPVRQASIPSTIPAPLNLRWPLAFWNLAFAPSKPYVADSAQDETWNRGAYLVEGPGHCGACHTPRAVTMQEKATDSSDPAFLSGALLDGWYAPSLRNDPNTGLGRWSEDQVVAYLRDGRNAHGTVFGSMLEAFNNSTAFMTEDDLRAIARYLKSLPGDPARDGTPWKPAAVTTASAGSQTAQGRGAQIYASRCSFCHQPDGSGKGLWLPPLAGVSSLLADHPESAINITLNGSGRVVAQGVPDLYRMPGFRAQLDDAEIADVLTYLRSTWGHAQSPVSAEAVARLRDGTDPASSQVMLLQMR